MRIVAPVIVVLLVIVAILVLPGSFLKLSVTPDTTGHTYSVVGMSGGSVAAGATHDLLDSDSYVTAWQSPGLSEKIVIYAQASLKPVASPLAFGDQVFTRYQYVVSAEGAGQATLDVGGGMRVTTPWSSAGLPTIQVTINGGWSLLDAPILKVVGPYVGKIHVDLYGDLSYSYLDRGAHERYDTTTGLRLIASDEAALKSGVGSVSVPSAPVEEGMEIVLHATTAYSHSSTDPNVGGWTLHLFDNKGQQVQVFNVPDNSNGFEVRYTVPIGSFDATQTANNNWKVVLRNELFDQSADWIVVIKAGATAQVPPNPSITYVGDLASMTLGSVLEYKVSGGKNPIGSDIAGFRVSVGVSSAAGITSVFIIDNQYYSASKIGDKWEARFSFTVTEATWYKIQANAIDAANIGSGFTSLSFNAVAPVDPDDPLPPPPPSTDPDNPATDTVVGQVEKPDWGTLLLGLAMAVLGILAGGVIMFKYPGPMGLGIGIVILLVLVMLGGYVVSGFVEDAQQKGIMIIQNVWR